MNEPTNIGIREIEDLFNEQLVKELQSLKCQHLKLIRGWIVFDETVNSPVLNVQAGNIVNIFLTISDFKDLWSKVTWRMIKDVLDKADKDKYQRSVSLLDIRKHIEARVSLHKKSGYTAKVRTYENATDSNRILETIIDLLPSNAYSIKVRRTSTIIVTNKNDKSIKYEVSVDSKFEEQAIYEGKIDVARQLFEKNLDD